MIVHDAITTFAALVGILLTCTLAMGPMLLDHEDDHRELAPFMPVIPCDEPVLAGRG